jgi:hypothetical protein
LGLGGEQRVLDHKIVKKWGYEHLFCVFCEKSVESFTSRRKTGAMFPNFQNTAFFGNLSGKNVPPFSKLYGV